MSAASKKCLAISPGMRMEPCEARKRSLADEFGSFRPPVFVHVNITFRDLTGSVDVIAVFIRNVRLIF
jgi:hypothetical protein